ncbi:MAG: adenine glycosylase [Eggerthellaceae bacterium]|nr:adenine glycosylase [Eggerthellaceae bacterium]
MAALEGAWPKDAPSRQEFIEKVYSQGKLAYREMPWRNISDAYGVLVSEVMLQQTQVSRALGRWERFMKRFPTVESLANAQMGEVLEEWQGLGYNRRALSLKRACETCMSDMGGTLPHTAKELQALPGIGPSTAAGVVAFAYNKPAVYLDTNVRAVFIHELFPDRDQVKDRELIPLVEDTCPNTDPRTWYYALLDYGVVLKSQGANPSRRSAQYARQSSFQGSHRQKRAEVLRIVLGNPGIAYDELKARLDLFEEKSGRGVCTDEEFDSIIEDLINEGFFSRDGVYYHA